MILFFCLFRGNGEERSSITFSGQSSNLLLKVFKLNVVVPKEGALRSAWGTHVKFKFKFKHYAAGSERSLHLVVLPVDGVERSAVTHVVHLHDGVGLDRDGEGRLHDVV